MPISSQYLICPLDESHKILKHRMQSHLLKCERQHDMSKKSKCPYNITHIVDTIVFPHHLETCPDAKSVLEYTYTTDDKPLHPAILPMDVILKQQKNIDYGDENWDTKRIGPGYDPSRNIENKSVFRQLAVATKSEKKAFREAECKRHATLENTNVVPSSRHSILNYNSKSSLSLGGSAFQINEPLRRPISESQTMSLENLSIGAIKKKMVLASQQHLASTTSILEEETQCDNKSSKNNRKNNSTINIIAKNLENIKLNDKKNDENKHDNELPKLGRLALNFGNNNSTKKLTAIGRGYSFKSLTKIPGETSTSSSSSRNGSSAWSSEKIINHF